MLRLVGRPLSALPSAPRLVSRLSCSFPGFSYSASPMACSTRLFSSSEALPPVSFRLNNLRDLAGARQHEKRVGRGKGSGYGKASGRGMKGQRRLGGVRLGFEGGQTPLYRRVPKRYVLKKTRFPTGDLLPLNLGRLQLWLEMGRLNPNETITMKHLNDSGIVGKIKYGVKLLGRDASMLRTPVRLEVTEASLSAIAAVEAAGGRVTTVYNSQLSLRALLKPEKFAGRPVPKTPTPPPKSLPYYLRDDTRGYLSRHVQLKAITEAAAGRSESQ